MDLTVLGSERARICTVVDSTPRPTPSTPPRAAPGALCPTPGCRAPKAPQWAGVPSVLQVLPIGERRPEDEAREASGARGHRIRASRRSGAQHTRPLAFRCTECEAFGAPEHRILGFKALWSSRRSTEFEVAGAPEQSIRIFRRSTAENTRFQALQSREYSCGATSAEQ